MKTWGQSSALQKWVPPFLRLATISDSSPVPAVASVYFRVPTPDSRLRVKISVLFSPPAGAANEFDITTFANLWLYEVEEDQSGVSGRMLGATNIEGTEAAPTAIPASAPLLGYTREFVSAADAIQGKFTILNNVTTGTWVVQVRYQPDSVRFTDEEWDALTPQCQHTLISPGLSF